MSRRGRYTSIIKVYKSLSGNARAFLLVEKLSIVYTTEVSVRARSDVQQRSRFGGIFAFIAFVNRFLIYYALLCVGMGVATLTY